MGKRKPRRFKITMRLKKDKHTDKKEKITVLKTDTSRSKGGKVQKVTRDRSHYRTYSKENLEKAYYACINDKMPVVHAASMYSVPETTLRDRVKGRIELDTMKSGPPPLFSSTEEKLFVEYLKFLLGIGYILNRTDVSSLATEYAIYLGKRETDQPLSYRWFYDFCSRWKDLKFKLIRGRERQRKVAISRECLNLYFQEYEKILNMYDIKDKPQYIYSVDEKPVIHNVKPLGEESDDESISSEHALTVTITCCANAQGSHIPPFFIFPGDRVREEVLMDATVGTGATVSATGCSNSAIFQQYLQDHLLRNVQRNSSDQHILLLYDGYASHISLGLVEWAKENKIILFVRPPYTSRILGPEEVGCLGPYERTYNSDFNRYRKNHFGNQKPKISLQKICEIACMTYTKVLCPEMVKQSFFDAGIYPADKTCIELNKDSYFLPISECPRTNLKPQRLKSSRHKNVKLKSSRKIHGESSKSDGIVPQKVDPSLIIEENACQIALPLSRGSRQERGKRKMKAMDHVYESETFSDEDEYEKESDSDTTVDEMDEEEDEHDDSEKCCVCNRYEPKPLARASNGAKFASWGQCMFHGCIHWVHLSFCCEVEVLDDHDTFYCPCHGLPVLA
ncbi:hypothetical protein ACJMK2_043365 [Sinanodonta woodiana]|uniref:DDE-1 domain-containing protein n=1 Tax=Sinanodonta woodiana TaxID=1069815 RepID=A0ABD3VWN9_SINWO